MILGKLIPAGTGFGVNLAKLPEVEAPEALPEETEGEGEDEAVAGLIEEEQTSSDTEVVEVAGD